MKVPEREVLVHETGHMMVGLHLGIKEASLQFTNLNFDERGRANFISVNVEPHDLVMRSLAGILSQAKFADKSFTGEVLAAVKISLVAAIEDTSLRGYECLLDGRCDLKWAYEFARRAVGSEAANLRSYVAKCERKVKVLLNEPLFEKAFVAVLGDVEDYVRNRWKDERPDDNPRHLYSPDWAKAIIRQTIFGHNTTLFRQILRIDQP